MYEWVLVMMFWTGSVLDGTPVETFKTFEQCREQIEVLQDKTILEQLKKQQAQLICFPERVKDGKQGKRVG